MPLTSFSASNYRGLDATLTGLGRLNFVYGLNESGKTSLLRAIDLYIRLLSRTVWEVWDGFEYDLDSFNALFSQSEAAFRDGERFSLSGSVVGRGDVRFDCSLVERRVKVETGVPEDVAEAFGQLRAYHRTLQEVQSRPSSVEELRDAQALYSQGRGRAETAWEPFRRTGPSRLIPPVPLPLDRGLRRAVVESWQSLDLTHRRNIRGALGKIGDLLGWDAPLEPAGQEDLALIREPRPVMLDDLGSGAQSLVGLVGMAFANGPANYLLFSEPEAHANPVVHPKVVALLSAISDSSAGMQLFVETHSARLAPADARIYLVEKQAQHSVARSLTHVDLQAFENRVADPKRLPMTSMLAHDFTIELSTVVREHLGLRPGDFVYFVERDGVWTILTSEQADAEMGPVDIHRDEDGE